MTKYGISHKSYPTLDIRKLSKEQAYRIYEQDYWDDLGLGSLPGPVAFVVFDSAVNQGPRAAIVLLQVTLGIRVDGIMGPETREATWRKDPGWLVQRFSARRLRLYSETQNYRRFGDGWINRSLDTMLEALKLRQVHAQQGTEL